MRQSFAGLTIRHEYDPLRLPSASASSSSAARASPAAPDKAQGAAASSAGADERLAQWMADAFLHAGGRLAPLATGGVVPLSAGADGLGPAAVSVAVRRRPVAAATVATVATVEEQADEEADDANVVSMLRRFAETADRVADSPSRTAAHGNEDLSSPLTMTRSRQAPATPASARGGGRSRSVEPAQRAQSPADVPPGMGILSSGRRASIATDRVPLVAPPRRSPPPRPSAAPV